MTTSNTFRADHTGYFHAHWARQAPTEPNRPFTFLDVKTGWGHLVGMHLYLEGQRDIIQGDPQMYFDQSQGAMLMGTGIEDWFNYAHGWEFQTPRNQSDPLSGVPAKGQGGYFIPDKKNPRKKIWKLHGDLAMINGVHAYRRLLVDVIPWNDGFRGYFEMGSNATHNNYRQADEIATTTFYYARPTSGLRPVETTLVSAAPDPDFEFATIGKTETYEVTSRFVGPPDEPIHTLTARKLVKGATATFNIPISGHSVTHFGAILRRVYDFGVFNQKASITVDGVPSGIWMTLGGNTFSRFAESDFYLSPELLAGKPQLQITLTILSDEWADFSYQLLMVV